MKEPPHASLGAALAREQDDALGDTRVLEVDLLNDIGQVRKRSTRWRRQIAAVFSLLCIAVVSIVVTFAVRFPVISYQIDGENRSGSRSGDYGQWVVSSADEPKNVRFTDGSAARVSPSSRLRIVGTSRRGASLTLESGAVDVHVAGGRVTEYQVGAGPFAVSMAQGWVQVSWDPMNEMLTIRAHVGFAIISGCQFDTGRSLVAGQELEVRCNHQ